MQVKFKVERETKNTVRYAEDAPEDKQVIGTLYLKKTALPDPFPQAVTVIVEFR